MSKENNNKIALKEIKNNVSPEKTDMTKHRAGEKLGKGFFLDAVSPHCSCVC